MIAINNLTFEIGARALYDEANWHIKPGEKIGLIGANGTGKTTLLKIIVGDYTPTSGTISMAKDLTMGYLNQDLLSYSSDKNILHVAMEAFERQNQLHDEIETLLQKLETDYTEDLLHKLSDKQHEFEALDGYNIEYKAHEILAGLGFSEASFRVDGACGLCWQKYCCRRLIFYCSMSLPITSTFRPYNGWKII